MKHCVRLNFIIIFSLLVFVSEQGHTMQLQSCPLSLMSSDEKNKALVDAIKDHNIDRVNSLIAADVDVNAFGGGSSFKTPLMVAAEVDNVDAIKVLVEAGADVNKSYNAA